MAERQLVAPPPGIEIDPLYMKVHEGHYGLTGYEITVFERTDVREDSPVPAVLFKGGWGDAGAVSCIPLAMVAAERFGRAATVGNRRLALWNPRTAIAVANTGKVRSQAMYAGMQVVMGRGSRHVIFAGQSLGGVTATEAARFVIEELPEDKQPEKIGVYTMDSPGMYGDIPSEMGVAESLAGLIAGMHRDLKEIPQPGNWLRRKMFERVSARELGYFAGECVGLVHVDASDDIAFLEAKNVSHGRTFHSKDVIPRIHDPSAVVYEGHHAAGLLRPVELINTMAAGQLREYADAA